MVQTCSGINTEPNSIGDLFDDTTPKDYWLLEWRRMMCRRMFEIEDSLCSTPVEIMPCKDCRYYVDGHSLSRR